MATITKKDLLEALDIEHTQCGDLSGTPYYEEKAAKIKTTYKVVKALIRFAKNEDEISSSSFDIWENATTPHERLKALLKYNVKHLETTVLNVIETDVKSWVKGKATDFTNKVRPERAVFEEKKTIKNVYEILNILDPLDIGKNPEAEYIYCDTDRYPIAATIQNTLFCFNGVKDKSIPNLDTRIKFACGGDEHSSFKDLKETLYNLKSDVDKARIMNQIMGVINTFVDDIKGECSQDRREERIAESNSGESYAEAFKQAAKNYSARSQEGRRGLFVVGNNRGNFSHNRIGLDEDAVSQMFKDFARTIPTTSEIAKEVTEVIKTSFEKELTDICVTHQKIEEIEKQFNAFINNKIPAFMQDIEKKIGDRFDNIIKALEDGKKIQEQLAAGQEAQGKDLKALREKQEKQDEINRRLDLYMTSTKAAIAKNMEQLNNIEKMLLLKEEKDRKDFDAVKKGLEGLEKNDKEIKEKIGGLLKEETAFQEFQKLWDHNNYIKQQNDDIKQQNDYIKTLLTELADNVYKQDEGEKNKIKSVIDSLEDKLTTLNDSIKNAIAASDAKSDAKLLGMIMPEIANLKDQNDKILIEQGTQTTILNSILSGQKDNALQYVAMSEKLDNLTELVIALGTKTEEHSFADNANKLLENFAKSQEAAFAKVAQKEDLKRVDTGIDSIINMLSDNSITLEKMNESIKSMVSQINVMAIDIKRVLEILSQTRIELGTVADCDRCHSADSMFYKCRVCGYDVRTTATPGKLRLYDEEKKFLIVNTNLTEDGVTYISELATHRFGNDKVNSNAVEKIVFDICDECKGACNQCNNTMTIKLTSSTHTSHEGENNIWKYFENLKAISFAKTKDGKEKYILGSDLLREDDSLLKIYATTFYGGQYLGKPEQGICNIKCDDSVDSNIVSDVLDHIDKTGSFHSKVEGSSEWRTPKTRNKEVK